MARETACCGASSATPSALPTCLAAQDFSAEDEPIVKFPAGITTISGQARQSRNTLPGARLEVVTAVAFSFFSKSSTLLRISARRCSVSDHDDKGAA